MNERTTGLDYVVGAARGDAAHAARVEWVERLVGWIRHGSRADGGSSPEIRLRFLLQSLERNPERRREVAGSLRATLSELSALGLLCDTGLPRAHAFFQELAVRVTGKLLPVPPGAADLAALLRRAFPRERDAEWIAGLSAPVLADVAALLRDGADPATGPWPTLAGDADDALLVLASQVQAIGLSERVRSRGASVRPVDSPFAGLVESVRLLVAAPRGSEAADAGLTGVAINIERCRHALAEVRAHLEDYGVSIDLVYQLERARLALRRMSSLVTLRASSGGDGTAVARFAADLIRANARQDSVRALIAGNVGLLARRVVESARRTGEHYITRDAPEYRAMLRAAAIGGALTGITVVVKLVTSGRGLPLFIDGLVASLNYAMSFVAIMLLGGTLATKQPAMTAAAIAAKLNAARHRGRLAEFVDEVASLVRSQVAAIAGNLLLVVPAALGLHAVIFAAIGEQVPHPVRAPGYIDALSLVGPTPVYAIFTGVLLWLSAVLGGWFENWAAYRRLPAAIAVAPRLVRWLGPERAARMAAAIERNVAGLGGNVALGFLLGMGPAVAAFFGVPLEVRHVTLSTGQLALASASSGAAVVALPAFWLAVAGIAAIGLLNLTVSFGLALKVAVRSTEAGAVSRARLRRAILGRLLSRPRDFLLPPRETPSRQRVSTPPGNAA